MRNEEIQEQLDRLESLVEQHQMVYDALGDAMTDDIHALEMKTYTPDEREA